MTTWRRTLPTLLVLAALTAGCGTEDGDDDASVAADQSTSTPSSSPATPDDTATTDEPALPTLDVPLELREVRLAADERPGRPPQALRDLDCDNPDAGSPDKALTACGIGGVGYLLKPAALVGGVTSAEAIKPRGQSVWMVVITYDEKTMANLEKVTGAAAESGHLLGFVLDGRVLAAASFSEALTDGVVKLDGTYTRGEAQQIATAITG